MVSSFGHVKPQRRNDSFRIELAGLFKVGLRLGELSLNKIEDAAVEICKCIIWIELDRLIEINHRCIIIAANAVNDTAIVVGVGILRVELDRLVKVNDGPIEITLLKIR